MSEEVSFDIDLSESPKPINTPEKLLARLNACNEYEESLECIQEYSSSLAADAAIGAAVRRLEELTNKDMHAHPSFKPPWPNSLFSSWTVTIRHKHYYGATLPAAVDAALKGDA